MFFLYTVLTFIVLWSKQTVLTCGIHYWLVLYLNDLLGNIFLNCVFYSFFNPQCIAALLLNLQTNLLIPTYTAQHIPASLLVGFYNIHPPLLYIGIISFIFYFNKKFNIFQFNVMFIWLIIFTAFVLGGAWGLGNGVWGYFWVNDLIEILLLSLSAVACYSFHIFKKEFTIINIFSIFLSICLCLLIIRIGVINTRHAFFDAKNLTSIFWSYSLYYFSSLTIVPALVVGWLSKIGIILIYIAIWQILRMPKLYSKSVKMIIFHIVIFSFLIVWLKYAEFNLSFKNFYSNEVIKNFFVETNSYILDALLNLKTANLSIFYTDFNILLSIKQVHSIGVYTRYLVVYFFLWIIFL